MKNPLVSVVIVAGKNRKKNLLFCLRSVFNSRYSPFEVILVDNSLDPGLSVIIKKKFPKVQIYRMTYNTGILGYSIGFANSNGDYIVGLDDDSAILVDTLQKTVNSFKKNPKKIGVISFNQYNPISRHNYFKHLIDLNLTQAYSFAGGACAFKKQMLSKIGYFDHNFFCWVHEEDFSIKMLKSGYQVYFDKEIIVNHFEKEEAFRKDKLFLIFRNKVWFYIKNFPITFFPVLIVKDIIWITMIYRMKKSFFYGLIFILGGVSMGILSLSYPLRERKVISKKIQKEYWEYYINLFNYSRGLFFPKHTG